MWKIFYDKTNGMKPKDPFLFVLKKKKTFIKIPIFIVIKYSNNRKYLTYLILDIKNIERNNISFFREKFIFLHYHKFIYYFFNH